MSPLPTALIAFAFVFGGAFLGMYVRTALPAAHFREDVKDVVRLSIGLIGTLAGIVLGLLIASAKSSYDARNTQIKQLTSNIILIDVLLEQYGPEAHNLRVALRDAVPPTADQIWNERNNANKLAPYVATAEAAAFIKKVQELKPDNEEKRELQARALSGCRRLTTDSSCAVCSGARYCFSAISCNHHFLAHNYFCKLRLVCSAQCDCDRNVFRRCALGIGCTFPLPGNGSAVCWGIADIQ